eukprot:gene2028-4794_t
MPLENALADIQVFSEDVDVLERASFGVGKRTTDPDEVE